MNDQTQISNQLKVGKDKKANQGKLVCLKQHNILICIASRYYSLLVRALDFQFRRPQFKTTGWLQVKLNLSSV